MGKTYENEFKVMIAELLLSGVKSKQVSKDYDLNPSMINRWRREYEERSGDFTKKHELSDADKKLRALEKELRSVKMERDILKKAVGIFSKSEK